MSGGHFKDNPHFKIIWFIEELKKEIEKNNIPDDWGDVICYSNLTISNLSNFTKILTVIKEIVHEIDYMYSGDIDESDFNKTFKELMNELKPMILIAE